MFRFLGKVKPISLEKKEFSKQNTLALKGIAIIMMMFHHCFLSPERFAGFDVSFFPIGQEAAVQMSLFFKICVSIFAFITGYGLMISYSKYTSVHENDNGKAIGKWTATRLIKTLSGYWIIVILSLIICQMIDARVSTEFFKSGTINGIWIIIANMMGVTYLLNVPALNGTWWYMSVAILFIVSIPVLAKIIKKHGYLVSIILLIAIPRVVGWKFSSESYFAFILPVLLGMLFAEKNLMVKVANFKLVKNKLALNKFVKFTISTALIIVLFIVYKKLDLNKFWEIHFGIIPVIYMIYFYEFWIELPILKHILVFLGKHSMNIFLIHTFIRYYYLNNFTYSQGNFIIIAFVLLGISLTISVLLELFKKLIRYDRFIECITGKFIKGSRKDA